MWHPDIPEEYRNQIVTGDARELAKRIPDESIDLIFTDPVYDRIEDYEWLAETALRVLKFDGALLCWSNGRWQHKNIGWIENKGLCHRWTFAQVNRSGMPRLDGKVIAKSNRLFWMDINEQSSLTGYMIDGYLTKPWSKSYSHNQDGQKTRYLEGGHCGRCQVAMMLFLTHLLAAGLYPLCV